MKTCGIIAEYNPFHNGHRYQIEETRKKTDCDVLIAVMSGNFVQRGEPAVISKRKRAEAAVRNGIDAVIELPYVHAVQGANGFARGGVRLLQLAGCGQISFGSECGNLENLMDIADTPVNPEHLREQLDAGMSYPRAYSLLTGSMLPNDILAVSYLKEIKGTDIEPVIIQRTTGYSDDTLAETASALAIRTALKEKKELLHSTPMEEQLSEDNIIFTDSYYPYLRTLLLTLKKEQLAQYFLMSEGMENHLTKQAAISPDWNSFLQNSTTYRYTASRIRRCCMHIMNQVTKEEVRKLPELDTLRVLAFNDTGRQWLKEMRKKEIRVASTFTDVPWPWRQIEYRTALLYTSVFPEEKRQEIIKEELAGAQYIR